MAAKEVKSVEDVFQVLRDATLNVDPVAFIENNLTIDGKKFNLTKSGYKPFADIYRYIALQAIKPDSMPVILVKGRQVGATTMAAALELYFATCGLYGRNGKPPMRIMHTFPILSLSEAYSKNKLNVMISSSRVMAGEFNRSGLNKSFIETKLEPNENANGVHTKNFINNNKIYIEGLGIDGDRIRGYTVDGMFYDECQDMFEQAIGASTKLLTQCQYGKKGVGIQVYFGTPKMKGGIYWKMWDASNQQYFHLGCEKCGQHFPLYRPDVNWEDIWIYGFTVRCTHCGHEQHKDQAAERGKWIAVNESRDNKYVGFHFNQLYIPGFTREDILALKPENSPTNNERIYMNEVLGEFFDGEGGTVSKEEIHVACGVPKRKILLKNPNDGKNIYFGFDWGQRGLLDSLSGRRQGKSYSCAVGLSVGDDGNFNVIYGVRLDHTDLDHKIGVVEQLYRDFGVYLSVGDIGDAKDISEQLHEKFGDQYIVSRSSSKINGHIIYLDGKYPKEIQFEKDYYLSEIFHMLKHGNIKFPYGDYDKISWLVDHCSSMDVKVTRDIAGEPRRTFVKGLTPNDGLMALLNAYLAWKCDVSNGFKIKDPTEMRKEKAHGKIQIPIASAYIPR